MLAQTRDCLEEEFSRPVESIMRCEDFKSNFARRLSNRYISRSLASGVKQDNLVKLRPTDGRETPTSVPERIEVCSQLSKCGITEKTCEPAKPPDKSATKNSQIQQTEVNALNMEVEMLRWQLGQTEANRQMHIALLQQIVTFLNRVKEHIDCQNNETTSDAVPVTSLPKSLNLADIPRSRSVINVNKNIEYPLSVIKKIGAKKISKSINYVNGSKDSNDCSGVWSQTKMSSVPENETGQKISEEMSRLITLAKTVLSTKLPDLACTNADNYDISTVKIDRGLVKDSDVQNMLSNKPNITTANCSAAVNTNCSSESYDGAVNNTEIETNLDDFTHLPSFICDVGQNMKPFQKNQSERRSLESPNNNAAKNIIEKRMEYINLVSNFIEDESGFSSMNSFQEIGIPIISIIPPSPCKEDGYLEDIPNIIEESEKWKTNTIDLEKQSVKVFWV